MISGTNIVNMVGGLGNQLFQYLFGHTLADLTGRVSIFDISDFRKYSLHDGLTIEKYFEIKLPLVSKAMIDQIPWLCRGYLRKRISSRLTSWAGLMLPIHTDYTYNLRQLHVLRCEIEYFFGYWQSQVYTTKELTVVKDLLNFRKEIQIAVERVVEKLAIVFENSAALHIRRGDYLASPNRAPQYALSIDFYLRAMDILAREKGISKFYAFSDDIEWVKSNFPLYFDLHFVDSSVSNSPGIDLCLMTKFSDMIISNSTFGWWAATLRKNDKGWVFYPDPWVKPKFLKKPSRSTRVADGWIAVEAFRSWAGKGESKLHFFDTLNMD